MTIKHNRIFLFLLCCSFSFSAFGSRINIANNGYRDIVVAISPDVKPDQANDLLDKIKVNVYTFLLCINIAKTNFCLYFKLLITEASAVLYEATRHRSYIDSVNILIPQTWKNVTANASTWENFQVN
jgi:hypothetical protein